MNELIARKSLDTYAFAEYLTNAETLDNLQHRICELEDTIEAMDDDIETAESNGLDEVVSTMCKARNHLNLERLELTIQVHKLEIQLAEFEKVRMLTK